jgi:hypothetical protein
MSGEPKGTDDASSGADETRDAPSEDLEPTAETAEDVKGGRRRPILKPSIGPGRPIKFE